LERSRDFENHEISRQGNARIKESRLGDLTPGLVSGMPCLPAKDWLNWFTAGAAGKPAMGTMTLVVYMVIFLR